LFEGARRRFPALLAEGARRSPRGFPLKTRLSLTRRSRHDDGLIAANVAGLLPGSDPALSDELVVVSAHYDHIGIGTAVDGDSIYNGALDNAAGTALLIELARELAAGGERPRRPILFLAAGAEEKGLIGSDYFAAHPTMPAARLVANINIDGAIPYYDFGDVIAFGAEQSQLAERLSAAAGRLGLAVAPDPFPEEGIFTRSDQYSFVRRGVPALFLFMGFTDREGRSVGRAVWDQAIARAHTPGDDLAQPIDYAVLAKLGEVARRLILETANAPARPLWYRDSPFAARFAPDQPTAERPAN
jgi:Zn-dependent M28 family amino/carboxypeptidase